MTTPTVIEFLSKELLVNKEIITFRLLSRELAVHVNEAKKELESFYETCRSNKQAVYATYLLIGEVNAEASINTDGYMASHAVTPSQKKIVLVGESQLEEARGQFLHPPSSHIYSLSPVTLTDAALLTTASDRVRSMDVDRGTEHNQSLGMIVSSNVQVGEIKSRVPETKKQATAGNPKPPTVDTKKVDSDSVNNNSKREAQDSLKKKVNTLDWSKAKPKTAKINVTVAEEKSSKEVSFIGATNNGASKQPKRGSKSSSDPASLTGSEGDKAPKVRSSVKQESPTNVTPGIVFSDDDEKATEFNTKPLATKRKGRVFVSDEEEEEHVDTENMIHDEEGGKDSGGLLDNSVIPQIPKAKRKSKASVPIGRNGLPKKRVEKTRKTKNAKGYTVTEDYSSYESVSESEMPTPPAKVQKRRGSEVTLDLERGSSGQSKVDRGKSKSRKDQEKKKKDLSSYFPKK